jgi:hypothetical protein
MSRLCHPFQAFIYLSLSIVFIFMTHSVHSAQITLQWDPNEPAPQGYQLYHRAEGETYNYAQPVYDGANTHHTVEVPEDGQKHFFVVRAYEGSDFSGDSNEAAFESAFANQQSGGTEEGAEGGIGPEPTPDQGDGEGGSVMVWPSAGEKIELTPDLLAQIDLGPKQPLHTQTRWLISTEADFSHKVMDITSQTALSAIVVPDLILDAGTVYFWKAEFKSSTGEILAQTPTSVFETIEASQSDDANSDGIPDAQTIQSGIDVDRNGIDDVDQDNILCVKSAKRGLAIGVKVMSENANVVAVKSIDDATQSTFFNEPEIMTLGIISFKVLLQENASGAEVTVYFSEPAPADALWYKYDINAGWRIYQDAVFSEDRSSVTFSIEDGGPGDDDGVRNGIIVDPSGLGAKSVTSPSTGASAASGETNCFIDTLTTRNAADRTGVACLGGLLSVILALFRAGISAARKG